MDRNTILANVSSLTAEQLFNEVKNNNVSVEDLRNTGELEPSKRTQLNTLLRQLESEDDKAWEDAEFGNEIKLSDYISNFPAGKHIQFAKDRIKFLREERNRANIEKIKILNDISNDPNSYTRSDISKFLREGIINVEELSDSGIPIQVINKLSGVEPKLLLGETPDSIPDGFTEVYFWGMPGSGKTCALAALLSTAKNEGYLEMAEGNGFDYMTKLSNIFKDGVAILPGPTPLEKTQYLPFTLKKPNEKYPRSISLIELSGEIFKCFLKENSGIELPSDQHKNTLKTLKTFLSGENRKIHFFFIDFETKNSVDDEGYTQGDYLSSALIYFNTSDSNIFSNTTDAIYIVLTKSDLLDCEEQERVEKAKTYLNEDHYKSFINSLKDKCRKNSINAGVLTVEPFTLGKLFFEQICQFDDQPSNNLLNILFERVKQDKKSLLDILKK